MSKATFEAPTVEEALNAAAEAMGVPVAELEHEVTEKKEDFWGMGDATVVIAAWRREDVSTSDEAPAAALEAAQEAGTSAGDEPDAYTSQDAEDTEVEVHSAQEAAEDADEVETEGAPAAAADAALASGAEPDAVRDDTDSSDAEKSEEPVQTEAQAPALPADKTVDESGSEAATDVDPAEITGFLEQVFRDMEFECTVTIEPEDGGFLATIDGADKDAILEGNGRCLSALELLSNNAFRHRLPRGSKVRVDAGDFRNRRDEELADLAFQVAHSAKESGRTQETQPLNPYERRLVHLALADDPAVTTRSRGSGFLKNVQVIPSRGGRSRGRRR